MTVFYSNKPTWHKLFKIEELNIVRPYSIQTPIDNYNDYSHYTTNPINKLNKWTRNNNWNVKKTDNNYDLSIRIIKFKSDRLISKETCENKDIKQHAIDIEYNNYFNISKITYSQNGSSHNRKFKIFIEDDGFCLDNIDNCWFHIIPTKCINDKNIFTTITNKNIHVSEILMRENENSEENQEELVKIKNQNSENRLLKYRALFIKPIELKLTNVELIDETFKYTDILKHVQSYYIDMADTFSKIIYDIYRIDDIILNINDLIKRDINLSSVLTTLENEKYVLNNKILKFLNIFYKQLCSINELELNIISNENVYSNILSEVNLNDKNHIKQFNILFDILNDIFYNLNENLNEITESRHVLIDMGFRGLDIGNAEVNIIEQFKKARNILMNIITIFQTHDEKYYQDKIFNETIKTNMNDNITYNENIYNITDMESDDLPQIKE